MGGGFQHCTHRQQWFRQTSVFSKYLSFFRISCLALWGVTLLSSHKWYVAGPPSQGGAMGSYSEVWGFALTSLCWWWKLNKATAFLFWNTKPKKGISSQNNAGYIREKKMSSFCSFHCIAPVIPDSTHQIFSPLLSFLQSSRSSLGQGRGRQCLPGKLEVAFPEKNLSNL